MHKDDMRMSRNYMKWERDTLTALRCSIPCCCNSSYHLTTTARQTLNHTCPAKPFHNSWTIKKLKGFWVYRADDWMLNRDEFIKWLVVLTNIAPRPRKRTHLLFSFSQIVCLNCAQGEVINEKNLRVDSAESAQLASFTQRSRLGSSLHWRKGNASGLPHHCHINPFDFQLF